MKTFENQSTEDMYITLPFLIAQEVIERMKQNKNLVIHLITILFVNGVLKIL